MGAGANSTQIRASWQSTKTESRSLSYGEIMLTVISLSRTTLELPRKIHFSKSVCYHRMVILERRSSLFLSGTTIRSMDPIMPFDFGVSELISTNFLLYLLKYTLKRK